MNSLNQCIFKDDLILKLDRVAFRIKPCFHVMFLFNSIFEPTLALELDRKLTLKFKISTSHRSLSSQKKYVINLRKFATETFEQFKKVSIFK